MSKRRLAYITVASLIVLTTIFAGVHTLTVKNAYAHALTMVTSRRSQSFFEQAWGLHPKHVNRQQQRTNGLSEIRNDDWLLSSMPTRAPPL